MSEEKEIPTGLITDIMGFPALNQRFEFISVDDKNPLLLKVRKLWHDRYSGENFSKLGFLNARDVEIEVLKRHEIWNQLSPEVKKELEDMTVEEKSAVHNFMAKVRGARKEKYKNVPRFLTCSLCQAKIPIAPGTLVKRAEKIAEQKKIIYTVEDFCKGYKCTKCDPKPRGRKPNPLYAHLPKELTCVKCNKKVKTNTTSIIKAAERKKITPEEYVAKFVCQSCFGTRGKHLRGKGTK